VEVVEAASRRLDTGETGAGGEELLGTGRPVEAEPPHERTDGHGVEHQADEDHAGGHGQDLLPLGQLLGQRERQGERHAPPEPTPHEHRLVAHTDRGDARDPLQDGDERDDRHGTGHQHDDDDDRDRPGVLGEQLRSMTRPMNRNSTPLAM